MFLGKHNNLKFNRKLNIKSFVRVLSNGKQIRVSPHSRKAAILRAKEALADLSKSKVEAGYVMNASGKLSKKYSTNMPHSLMQIMPTRGGKSTANIAGKKGVKVGLHNHPTAFNPPSGSDIAYAVRYNTQELVQSKDGSIFRVAASSHSKSPEFTKNMMDTFYGVAKSDLTKVDRYPTQLKQELQEWGPLVLPENFPSAYGLAVRDYGLKQINRSGRIKYRSKLSPQAKQIQKKYLDHIKSLYSNSDVWKEFTKTFLV
jgi:hypothetical protein